MTYTAVRVSMPAQMSCGPDCLGYTESIRPHAALNDMVLGDYRHGRRHSGLIAWRIPAHLTVSLCAVLPSGSVDGTLMARSETQSVVIPGPTTCTAATIGLLGARRIFGELVGELDAEYASMADLLHPADRHLVEQLHQTADNRLRSRLLDRLLLSALDRTAPPAPEVAYAWQLILQSAGRIPIATVAAETGWSHNYLIRRFKRELGITPKAMARVVRVQTLLQRIDFETPMRWSDAAANAGYSDQAHLHRDFRELVGATPAQYRLRAQSCGCMDALQHSAVRAYSPAEPAST